MVVADDADDADGPVGGRIDEARRLIADGQRLGKLRITARFTDDGLGIHIPPSRQAFGVAFMMLWLCGWAAGELFAIRQLATGPFWGPDLFLLIWLVPWTAAGAGVLWIILWQLFGVEQLFFTADALVREWGLLGVRGRRVVLGADIVDVTVSNRSGTDVVGLGTIRVTTSGRTMRIGNGLSAYEADLVARLIRDAAAEGRASSEAAPA